MTLGTSPTASNTTEGGPVTPQKFGEYVKYFQQSHKAIVRWTAILNNPKHVPPSQALTIKDPATGETSTIKKSDVARYSATYIAQLGDLKKIYANRKRKGTRTNSQLNSLFYVSDQLVAFYTKANLGPIDPETGKGKLSDKIGILTEKRMSTSGILTSLIARYIEANELKTEGSSGRFMPDTRMKKALSTSNYRLNSVDLSKRKPVAGTPEDKVEKIKQSVSMGKKSAFDRVSDRVDKRSGEPVFNSKTGLLYTTMMVFNNFYRIPNALLTDSEREALTDHSNIEEAKELQQILTYIKEFNHKSK